MSIGIVNVVVPLAGDGPVSDVSTLVGEKTVELSGIFNGRYILLGSQDYGASFVPVLIFDSNGKESVKLTLPLTLSSVRVRAAASSPQNVSMNISGVIGGTNLFATLASIPAGGSGPQAIIDLNTALPPASVQQDIGFLCSGSFNGLLVIEGSMDGVEFNPIGDGFRDVGQSPSLLGTNRPLEFSPMITDVLVRYIRVNLIGVASSLITVTVAGSNPVSGSVGTPMSLIVSDSGGGTYQALGTPAFPALAPFVTLLGSGNTLNTASNNSTVVGSASSNTGIECVFVGSENHSDGSGSDFAVVVGNRHTVGNSDGYSALVGYGNNLADGNDHTILIGSQLAIDINSRASIVIGVYDSGSFPLERIGQNSPATVVIGYNSSIGNSSYNANVIGAFSQLYDNCDGSTVLGSDLILGCVDAVMIGVRCGATFSDRSITIASDTSVDTGCGMSVTIGSILEMDGPSSGSILMGRNSSLRYSSDSVVIGPANLLNASTSLSSGVTIVGNNNNLHADIHDMTGMSVFGSYNDSTGVLGAVIVGNNHIIADGIDSMTFGIHCNITVGLAPSQALLLGKDLTAAGNSSITIGIGGTNGSADDVLITSGGSIGANSDGSVCIGLTSTIGDNSGTSVSINSSLGAGSTGTLAVNSTVGDGVVACVALGGSTVGAPGGTACLYNTVIGNTSGVEDQLSNCVLIGGGNGTSSIIRAGASYSVLLGSRSEITTNSIACTLIGTHLTSNSAYCIIMSVDGSVGATSDDSTVIGHGSSVGTGSGSSIVLGASASVADGAVSAQAYGTGAAATLSAEVIFNANAGGPGVALFHAMSTASGNPDLLKYDVSAMSHPLDSAMFLLYLDSTGAILMNQVLVQADTGYLYVPVTPS